MSFWRTFGLQNTSPIDTILERDVFTLEELLDEDDLLTECKGQNKKLIEFLVGPAALAQLLGYLTNAPADPSDEKLRYKYPYLACEILCLDIWDISDAVFASPALLTSLWGFFAAPPPIDNLLCAYVTRVCAGLLQRKVRAVFDFLRQQDSVVANLVQHFDTPTVMELVLRLIACDEISDGAGMLAWLCDEGLLTRMADKLTSEHNSSFHENVALLLETVIDQTSISRDSPFIDGLLGGPMLQRLVDGLHSDCRSVFTACISVVTKLLERFTKEESLLETISLSEQPEIIRSTLSCLDSLHDRLAIQQPSSAQSSSPAALLPVSNGEQIIPVGSERLKILDLLSVLVRLRSAEIDDAVLDSKVVQTALALFVAYPWNNFLHAAVRNLISDFFSGINTKAKLCILDDYHFLDILADAAIQNNQLVEPIGISAGRGFMGFVIQMSNGINQSCSSEPALAGFLDSHAKWREYSEGLLEKLNAIERTEIGDHRKAMDGHSDTSSDDAPFDGAGNSELVSVYKQYLCTHQFTNNYSAIFGDLNEDDEEYEDDDSPAPTVSNEQLVLDRAFEQDAQPYSTLISGYYDAHHGDDSSDDDAASQNFDEFDSEDDHSS